MSTTLPKVKWINATGVQKETPIPRLAVHQGLPRGPVWVWVGARLPAFETDSTPRCSSAAFALWSDSHTSHVIFSHTFYRDSMPSWPRRQRRAFQRSGRHRGLLKGNRVNWCQTVAGGYFHSAVGGKWKRCVDSSLPRGRSFHYSWKSNGLIWSGTKSSKELWQISPAPLSLSE